MTEEEREAIHCLWDRLVDFPVAQMDEALVFLLGEISRMVGAGNAFWLGALRMAPGGPGDCLQGWRPRANRYLHPAPVHDEAYRAQVAKMDRLEANEGNRLAVREAGTFRSLRVRQLLPTSFFEGDYFRTYHGSRGFYDELYVIFPLHEDCESYFAFFRVGEKRDFTAREEEIASYALRGLKWFHRKLVLSRGVLLAESPLSPMQREISEMLLTERSEKQIATELSQSPNTTHRHVKEIFRKYGVNSRAALMALWLGRKS